MKILFMDCDGVLNSAQSAHFFHRERQKAKAGDPAFLDALGRRALREEEFCPIAVSNLLYILEEVPDLEIVVSSTWRMGRTLEELKTLFGKIGVDPKRVIGKTPALYGKERGIEIQAWLDDWQGNVGGVLMPVDEFVIVDDSSDMAHLMPHLVQTDCYVGLDFRKAHEIKRRFLPEIKPLPED